jgi:hypothetical protein
LAQANDAADGETYYCRLGAQLGDQGVTPALPAVPF